MFLELIATFVAGFAGAGVILLLNKVLGGRLPRWLMPVAAGAAMLFATISSEYSWYPRTQASLPEGLEIVETVDGKAFYRPWTYLWPFTERFVAVDVATVRSHSDQPGKRLGDIYLFGRWSPVHKIPVLADCQEMRRAALTDAISFNADGTVSGAEWNSVDGGDVIVAAMCQSA